jgi:hypothetical protein
MTIMPTQKQLSLVKGYVKAYREAGFNPLPSRMDSKRPMIKFAEYWYKPLPEDIFEQFPTTNVQVMTGQHWGLVVFDLDGPEAVAAWPKLVKDTPRTWVTHSGNGGEHWWYLIHATGKSLRKAEVWRPTWPNPRVKGDVAIERLGDKSLVVAPPSIHPTTKRMYKFKSRWQSPVEMSAPAWCPDWIIGLPVLKVPRVEPVVLALKPTIALNEREGTFSQSATWREVLDAIPSKVDLAQSWGLRIASQKPNANGWVYCHAIGRLDAKPSASFNVNSGYYVDHATSTKLSLFELGVALGHYYDWQHAKDVLAACYVPTTLHGQVSLTGISQVSKS